MAADGRVRRAVRLSAERALHERLLREVLGRVQDLNLVLKGGSALAFFHGAGRHSTDLDFDGRRKVELRGRIRKAARAAGVALGPVKRTDRRLRQRYLAKYPDPADDGPEGLKVDIHFRHAPKRRDIEVADGVQIYTVEAIFDQKMAAARSRIKARDLFDIAFGLESYGGRLSDNQIERADTYFADRQHVWERYSTKFEQDEVLKSLTTLDKTLGQLREAINKQRRHRWPQVQYQRIPIPGSVRAQVLVYQSRLRARSLQKSETGPRFKRNRSARPLSAFGTHRKSLQQREEGRDRTFSR